MQDMDGEGVWPCLLGGSLLPLGQTVAFVDAPLDEVLAELVDLRGERGTLVPAGRLPGAARHMDPMEMPWTREIVIACDGWTAYLNNAIGGGDITAVAPAIARGRGWRLVSAQHCPKYGPGHAATQLWLQGPEGAPPLGDVRTLSAHAEDGRWSWHESGTAQPFERVERYKARRKRERLDRALLVEYLAALRIRVDDPTFFGEGVLLIQDVPWQRREESVAQFRLDNR